MYNKNVAITGCTIEKTTKYDYFREDKIRMELYRIILFVFIVMAAAHSPAIYIPISDY